MDALTIMKKRIAIGQISSESNSFVPMRVDEAFIRETGYLAIGDEVFELKDTGNEVAGFLDACSEEEGIEIVPLLAGRANSSGPLTSACYSHIKCTLLDRLKNAGPVDGVLLSHHGSMLAENIDDPEGDIIAAMRGLLGPRVPIAATLDLHGNVTRRMVEAATIIIGYQTYPHLDAFDTGKRAAHLLIQTINGNVQPTMAVVKLPMLLTAFHGTTQPGQPFGDLMQHAVGLEQSGEALSASLFFVGSYIDVPEMGCAALVITNGNLDPAVALSRDLADKYWAARDAFTTDCVSVYHALRQSREIGGRPILLLDTPDTTGGGAAGDSIALVRELLQAGVKEPTIAMVVDPEVAATAHHAGRGARIQAKIGHRLDPQWGRPIDIDARVEHVTNGNFVYQDGILKGSGASMGKSAVLDIGSIKILVASVPTYDCGLEQYESVGIDPKLYSFIGVKNMMNFRHAYGSFMKGYFPLDLPGPTPADLRTLPFKRVRRPIYPLDDMQEPLKPTVLLSKDRA